MKPRPRQYFSVFRIDILSTVFPSCNWKKDRTTHAGMATYFSSESGDNSSGSGMELLNGSTTQLNYIGFTSSTALILEFLCTAIMLRNINNQFARPTDCCCGFFWYSLVFGLGTLISMTVSLVVFINGECISLTSDRIQKKSIIHVIYYHWTQQWQ